MNYLAHLYLADATPASIVGNLIADFIKGSDLSYLPEAVEQAIRLHRRVDSFTDSHPLVQRSIGRVSPAWGWYSGILIDVYYDHILATTWQHWSDEPLRNFVDRVHACLIEHVDLAPADGREMIVKLVETDRLYSYLSEEGIHEALFRLSRRIRERMPGRDVHLELALPYLRENLPSLTQDFLGFFPELIQYAAFVKQSKERR